MKTTASKWNPPGTNDSIFFFYTTTYSFPFSLALNITQILWLCLGRESLFKLESITITFMYIPTDDHSHQISSSYAHSDVYVEITNLLSWKISHNKI